MSEAMQAVLAARERTRIDRANPVLADLPDKFKTIHQHQQVAVQGITAAFRAGAKCVMLDAPTGSGKTLIGEITRRILGTPATYACTSKQLQDQFVEDFGYAKVLKGRGNYPTRNYRRQFHPGKWPGHVSCEDCTATPTKPECKWCGYKSACPYEGAKRTALSSELAVLNTAYWLTECNGPGRFDGRPLVVLDEADMLESSLMDFVTVDVGERRMEKYGWDPPKKVTVAESWMEWLRDRIPEVTNALKAISPLSEDTRDIRERKYLDNLQSKLRVVLEGLEEDRGSWVYTGKERWVTFRPARVSQLGKGYLWSHGPRFLLMSATIVSATQLSDDLGLDERWELVRVPSTFPKERRPIKVVPIADMGRKSDEREELMKGVSAILARHRDERVLVHTVSYDLARDIHSSLQSDGRPIISYMDAHRRQTSLAEFLSSKGGVLVAPSMDRGIDLPGDACRVQIIAKVPYPYLGDRQVNARLYSQGGRSWYTVQTVRTVVQMSGRGMRSESDWVLTYIVDKQFNRLWGAGRGLFPRWWTEALEWHRGLS